MGEKLQWKNLKFSSSFWGITLGGIYIAAMWFSGGLNRAPVILALYITLHLIFFSILRSWWYYFFAQFILPVRTNADRKKIYQRLIQNTGGAALFIEDGKLIESEGESEKSGAGVIVLDSASAVVLKKTNQYTKTAGPGVLFTDKGETIAEAPVPLQKLRDTAGPKGDEDPFAPKSAHDDIESYTATQRRRYETSGLTRDAVEIVPNISITFKIDADPAKENEDGSRFGYNGDAVRKAIWHTTTNHQNDNKNIYWNQLPINLAADLWREYLGKYRFEELFKAEQKIKPEKKDNAQEKNAPPTPTSPPPHYEYQGEGILCEMLLDINAWLGKKLKDMDERISPPLQEEEKSIETPAGAKKEAPTKETALQSITRYMSQRLKESTYTPIDRYGKPVTLKSKKPNSPEYHFLKERGIRVVGVSVNNLHFSDKLEKEMINGWSSTWVKNAKEDQSYVEKQTQIRKTRGKEKALIEYATALSENLEKENPREPEQALKLLLMATRKSIIQNPALHKETEKELEQLIDLMQWIDKGVEQPTKSILHKEMEEDSGRQTARSQWDEGREPLG